MTVLRRIAGALALGVLLPIAAAAQSTGLRALDTDHEARGWEAIGRLETGIGFCTATLIAPDLVLSAAHCVYDMRTGAALAPEKFTFRAGLRNGKAAATRKIARIAAHPGFAPSGAFTGQNVQHDLALLQLAERIPTHEIDPFILHDDRVRPGEVSVVSYGRGRANLQSRQRQCHMLERQGPLLAFDCDVTNGSSGAPVFSHLNGRGRILSVISGEVSINGREVALGMHLPPLVGDLKRQLRAATPAAPTAKVRRIGVGQTGGSSAKFVRAKPGG